MNSLIDALPVGRMKCVVYRSDVRQHLIELLEAEWSEGDLYFTTSTERFTPVAGEAVRELTCADSCLFDGSEIREPQWEFYGGGHWVFGILRNGRVACKTGTGEIGPVLPSGRRLVAISGLYTDSHYRRQGLAKRLVSHVTETILRDGHIPVYWTEPENIASQNLCRKLGYWQYGQRVICTWQKR